MCNKVVDACLSALSFVPDWFGTHEMLKIVDGIDYDFDNDFDDDFYDGTDDYVDDIDDSFDNYLDNDYDYILSLIAWLGLLLGVIDTNIANHIKKRFTKI